MNMSDISAVIDALKRGAIIVYPTDTLYGMGADIFNEQSVNRVFEIKKRPIQAPLPVAVSSLKEIEKLAIVDENSKKLIKKFLPGRLTLVLKKKIKGINWITGSKDTIAIRIPDNKIALNILSNFGPITATSANIHGQKPQLVIKDIQMQLIDEDIAYYIDDGLPSGLPSTIVDMTIDNPRVIRKGDITQKMIDEAIRDE